MRYYSADFETTTDPEDVRVWAWGICDLANPDTFTWGTRLEDFMDYMRRISPCRIYFHNLAFDGAFILDYILNKGWDWTDGRKFYKAATFSSVISDSNQMYKLDLSFGGKKHAEILDSLKVIPMSVSAMAPTFGLPECKGEIDYDKVRPVGYVPDDVEIDYLRRDVQIVARAMQQLIDAEDTKMTAGANALADFKHMEGGNKAFRRTFPVLDAETDTFHQAGVPGRLHLCESSLCRLNTAYGYLVGRELPLLECDVRMPRGGHALGCPCPLFRRAAAL